MATNPAGVYRTESRARNVVPFSASFITAGASPPAAATATTYDPSGEILWSTATVPAAGRILLPLRNRWTLIHLTVNLVGSDPGDFATWFAVTQGTAAANSIEVQLFDFSASALANMTGPRVIIQGEMVLSTS